MTQRTLNLVNNSGRPGSMVVFQGASGSVSAEGQVDTLIVQVMGSGHANLGMLRARRVEVVIAGSGDVTIAPGEALKVSIMGSGDVRLMTHPAKIERSIMGSGSIIEQR